MRQMRHADACWTSLPGAVVTSYYVSCLALPGRKGRMISLRQQRARADNCSLSPPEGGGRIWAGVWAGRRGLAAGARRVVCQPGRAWWMDPCHCYYWVAIGGHWDAARTKLLLAGGGDCSGVGAGWLPRVEESYWRRRRQLCWAGQACSELRRRGNIS